MLDRNHRARRMRALKIATAGAAGLAAAAGVGLALQSSMRVPASDASSTMLESTPLPPRIVLDAGVDVSRRK